MEMVRQLRAADSGGGNRAGIWGRQLGQSRGGSPGRQSRRAVGVGVRAALEVVFVMSTLRLAAMLDGNRPIF